MKRFLSILLVLAMVCCLVLPAAAASAYFSDVPTSSWFYSNVKTAYEQGLMVGVSDTEFKPGDTLTRAMFVTILGRVAKIKTADYKGKSDFSDVPKDIWFEPYVAWAQAKNVTSGMGGGKFAPNDPVTREQMAAMIQRYVKNSGATIPYAASPAAPFKDAGKVSSWAAESVEYMRLTGLLVGDNKGNFNPKNTATRAEAASVFIRLYKALYGSFPAPVNTWLDKPPEPPEDEYDLPEVSNPIVSNEELITVLKAHPDWFTKGGRRYNALVSINTKYAAKISNADRAKPLVFLFEGAGATSDIHYRMNAMCVVVKGGKIAHINLYSSTIPDYPFDPSRNAGTAMPTIKSGIFSYWTTFHNGTYTHCPALHAYDSSTSDWGVPVVRHTSRWNVTSSTCTQINIHRRFKNTIPTDYSRPPNSAGCLLAGREGEAPGDDFAQFCTAVGIINPGKGTGTAYYDHQVGGRLIIDRDAAGDYLKNIGFTPQAIALMG